MITVASELYDTTLTAAFTGILWIPIIVNRLAEMGPWKVLKNPEPEVRPHSDWAYRLASAHRSALENLVVLARRMSAEADSDIYPSIRKRVVELLSGKCPHKRRRPRLANLGKDAVQTDVPTSMPSTLRLPRRTFR